MATFRPAPATIQRPVSKAVDRPVRTADAGIPEVGSDLRAARSGGPIAHRQELISRAPGRAEPGGSTAPRAVGGLHTVTSPRVVGEPNAVADARRVRSPRAVVAPCGPVGARNSAHPRHPLGGDHPLDPRDPLGGRGPLDCRGPLDFRGHGDPRPGPESRCVQGGCVGGTDGVLPGGAAPEPVGRHAGGSTGAGLPAVANEALARELTHRTKNLIAAAVAIVRQTSAGATCVASFANGLIGRLHALAIVQDLLLAENWDHVSLHDLAATQIALAGGGGAAARTAIHGPPIRVAPELCQWLGLALHELGANARRHGALATDGGSVRLDWHIEGTGGDAHLMVWWREVDGPPVVPPVRHGFGLKVLTDAFAGSMAAEVSFAFERAGVRALLSLPAAAGWWAPKG